MTDHFSYFAEIEQRFCQRRGTVVLCSALDWALMETWKDAGIPLEAVLRGIDAAFDRYDARPNKTRKVNSLAYCAQEVLAAAEDMREAAIGSSRELAKDTGLGSPDIAAFLKRNAAGLKAVLSSPQPSQPVIPASAVAVIEETAGKLTDLATGLGAAMRAPLEDLERRLTVLEERIMAVLLAAQSEEELLAVRADADRELAPYRRKMSAAQIDQLMKQFVHKRLLERYRIPRLSLFYM
jgi:hypothetical protein